MNNEIVDIIKKDEKDYIESLNIEDSLLKIYKHKNIEGFLNVLLIIPVVILVMTFVIPIKYNLNPDDTFLNALIFMVLPTFLIGFAPFLIFKYNEKNILSRFTKRYFKKYSDEQIFNEIKNYNINKFYDTPIPQMLHDKIKIVFSMDEYKNLCFSGKNISEITYGQLSSFINDIETLKEKHKIIENNKLSICSDSEVITTIDKKTVNV